MTLTTQEAIIILEEASYHHSLMIFRLHRAMSEQQVGKWFESLGQLIQATNEYYRAIIYLRSTNGDSVALIEAISIRLGANFNGSSYTDNQPLVNILTILIQNTSSSVQIGRMMDLTLNGTLNSYQPVEDALRTRLVTLIKAQIPNFDETGKTLSDLWNGAPNYPYDRDGAAQYAIDRSRINFETDEFPTGINDLTASVNGRVNGIFTNYTLYHKDGITGSAIFISEVLYQDGFNFPMVNAISPADNCDRNFSTAESGWRVCCDSVDGATLSWTYHLGITKYYSEISNDADMIGTVEYNFLAERIRFGVTIGQEIGGGTWKPNTNKQDLYDMFRPSGLLASIDTGDYVFIDQNLNNPNGPGSHGFIIVGWGLAEDVPNGLNSNDISVKRQFNGHEIPYIVDFAYGYNGTDTGWLQDVRPRPFYASAARVDTSDTNSQVLPQTLGSMTLSDYRSKIRGAWNPFSYFFIDGSTGGTSWQFFHMPDNLIVPDTRIYIPPCKQ